MQRYLQFYIDGQWCAPAGQGAIDVHSASTEEVIAQIPEGTPADVDAAVKAARRAFYNGWGATTNEDRAVWLEKLAGALQSRTEAIARTISQEVGAPITMSTQVQAGLPVMVTGSYAKLIRESRPEQTIGDSRIVREPVGVVGAITPWNYPLHQIMAGRRALALAWPDARWC